MAGGIDSASSSGFVPLTLDSNLLAQYFTLRAGNASDAAAPQPPAAKDPSTLPPWDSGRPQLSDTAALKDALTATKFLETKGNYFDRADIPDDQKKLFSLYIALSRLTSIAHYAAQDSTVSGLRTSLDERLQRGLDEVTQFLSTTKFDDLTLMRGNKSSYVQASNPIALRAATSYVGSLALDGDIDTPLAGINGDEVFTISIKKNGTITNIPIDLSLMAAPPTLGNIANFINDTLAANGMLTRFATEKLADHQYALKISDIITESVTLSAPTTAPAVYVAGNSGAGDGAQGQVLRLDAPAGSEPTLNFSRHIEGASGGVSAKASALDSQGNLYVLGATKSDLGNESVKGAQDVYLTKYDSRGQVLWTHLLGAGDTADGMALAVDASDNVVVAGSLTGKLSSTAIGGGTDSFVTKFNSYGEEIFTRQIAPIKDDAATSLVLGADGSIYVGGWTKGAIGGNTLGGGTDGYLTKLDNKGKLVYTREFGGAGEERTQAVALAADGGLLVASVEDGHAILRKYDSSSGSGAATWEKDLGALSGGTIGAIAVDGNDIYVGGSTGNAALDAGGEATITAAANGGTDGFVMRLTDGGADVTAVTTTYLGTSGTDSIKSLTVSGGAVYVAGTTDGALPGETKSGGVTATNGFAAKLESSGDVDWIFQYGGQAGVSSSSSIVVDPTGSSVLDVLGLPRGRIDNTRSALLTANTSLREGDSFSFSVNGKPAQTVRIAAGETRHSLTTKINALLLNAGKASSVLTPVGYALKIAANPGTTIEIKAGPAGSDALISLGLAPGSVFGNATASGSDDATSASSKFVGLELDPVLSLTTKDNAKKAEKELQNALSQVKAAYRKLTLDPLLAQLKALNPSQAGSAPAYLQSQLANYQTALAWLTSSTSSSLVL